MTITNDEAGITEIEMPGYIDKIPYTTIWRILIEYALKNRGNGIYHVYYRFIDTLWISLFKDLRDKVNSYKILHKKPETTDEFIKTQYYDNLLMFIIDLLEENQYLDKRSTIECGSE